MQLLALQFQGQQRNLIQVDAQTRAQMQHMDPQQQAAFLQKRMERQKQLLLQRQMQVKFSNRLSASESLLLWRL